MPRRSPVKPAPGLAIEQQSSGVLLRMCLWAEARGESSRGKLAVAWVIKNRAAISTATYRKIILQPLQFSAFNRAGMRGIKEDDPNRAALLRAYETDRVGWAMCDAVAELFESGDTIDPTGGATHYYNHNVVTPKWGAGHPNWKPHVVIGNHTFGSTALSKVV